MWYCMVCLKNKYILEKKKERKKRKKENKEKKRKEKRREKKKKFVFVMCVALYCLFNK